MSRLRRIAVTLAVLAAVGVAVFLLLTRPRPLSAGALPDHEPDAARGEVLYNAASCRSCHEPAEGTPGADEGLPTGTTPLPTPAGTFYGGNLTPDPETGLGDWSALDLANALTRGVSPEGTHYFPALPYSSYRLMPLADVMDLHAYLMSLPAVRSPTPKADVPPLARRGVGIWKLLALQDGPYEPDPERSEAWNRGAYLTNGPGHCGECHTPRGALMILDESRHLAGGPHPAEEGDVPGLRGLVPEKYKDAADLTLAMQFGETFGYDGLSSGGMAKVQENLGLLPESEVQAISEYLISLE